MELASKRDSVRAGVVSSQDSEVTSKSASHSREHLTFAPDTGTQSFAASTKRRRNDDSATLVEFIFTPCGQVASIVLAGVLLLAIGSVLWAAAGGDGHLLSASIQNATWASYILFIDPGTQTGLRPSVEGPWVLVVAVVQSVSGFLFLLVVLGIVVDRVRSLCARYRELHFRIIQRDHVLILGWNDKTLFLIRELCNMYDSTTDHSRRHCRPCCHSRAMRTSTGEKILPVIIVLSQVREETCLQQLRTAFSIRSEGFRVFLQGVEIIFAEGNPTEPDALRRVSLNSARFVMILGDSADRSNTADQKTLRTVLAVQATLSKRRLQVVPQRRLGMFGLDGDSNTQAAESSASILQRQRPPNGRANSLADPTQTTSFTGTLIAEVRVKESADVIRTIGRGMDLRVVSMRTTINATYALHALVPTLGQFFAEIMRYDGNELYCSRPLAKVFHGGLIGLTFAEACSTLGNEAIVIGYVRAATPQSQAKIVLAPAFASQRKLMAKDKLIFLAAEVGDLTVGDNASRHLHKVEINVPPRNQAMANENKPSTDNEPPAESTATHEQAVSAPDHPQIHRKRSSLSVGTTTKYTSELLTRQRSFLMIGYPTDMGDYLDTFNRFLRLRTVLKRHRHDSPAFQLWMDCIGRQQARCAVKESLVYETCVESWQSMTESERYEFELEADSLDSTASKPAGAGAPPPTTEPPPGSAGYEVPLRDSEAHHIYVLSDKSAEWRYYRFLAAGRPWKAVSFHPFDDTCADGEWVPDAAESVDEVLRRGGTITTRFGDLLIHHLHGDPDSAAEIEEAIIFVTETNKFGAGKKLDAVLILADCDDTNSLVSDSSTLTSLLHVRTLAETLVTIQIRVPEGQDDTAVARRAILEDIVEHLNGRATGFDSSLLRFTPDPTGEFRFIRTALNKEACAALRNGLFRDFIADIIPVLQHWREGGNEVSRVVTEVLDIDTDRILRNNPLLRSKSVFFPSNLLETGMFAFNAQSQEVNAVLHSLLGNILYNADMSQRNQSVPSREEKSARPAIYPIAFGLLSRELLQGRHVASFNELQTLIRTQDAVLLGWNRRADEDAQLGSVDNGPFSPNSQPGIEQKTSLLERPTSTKRKSPAGDRILLKRSRSKKHPQPRRRLCINPDSKDEPVAFRQDDELIILLRPNAGAQ